MTPITEEEAAKLVCPFTLSAAPVIFGDGQHDPIRAGCIGKACMLWQPEGAPTNLKPIPTAAWKKHYVAPTLSVLDRGDALAEYDARAKALSAAGEAAAKELWPGAELKGIEEAGGSFSNPEMRARIVEPTGKGTCGASR